MAKTKRPKHQKIVVAPQAFKNCATAGQVARAISCGVQRKLPDAEVISFPIADGGDGTLSILLEACHGMRHRSEVQDAFGETHYVEWGVINGSEKIAVIESALVCGMATVPQGELDPLMASTYGVGELIKIIVDNGYRKIFVGLGGSATNDGGTGLARALGARFLNNKGHSIPLGGGALTQLAHIDISNMDRHLKQAEIIVGCDVIAPLLGPDGATHVYAPQKGATQKMVIQLEKALSNYAAVALRDLGIDISTLPYGGAAGGMASGLHLFCKGHLVGGAPWILEKIGFADIIKDADLLITGEGRMDGQTAEEKGPMVAAQIAKRLGVPVVAIVGAMGPGSQKLKKYGIDKIIATTPEGASIPDNALTLLEQAAESCVIFSPL